MTRPASLSQLHQLMKGYPTTRSAHYANYFSFQVLQMTKNMITETVLTIPDARVSPGKRKKGLTMEISYHGTKHLC